MAPTEMVYALIGLALVAWIYWINRELFRGGGFSALELVCYLIAVPALIIGWYFNIAYLREYGDTAGWWHWTTLLFVNPASASGGRSEEHTSELQSLMRTSSAGFCLKTKQPTVKHKTCQKGITK